VSLFRFEVRHDSTKRAQFAGGTASFSVVAGTPAENVSRERPRRSSLATA